MTPFMIPTGLLQVFAALFTVIAGYLVALIVAILLLVIAEFAYEAAHRVHAHAPQSSRPL